LNSIKTKYSKRRNNEYFYKDANEAVLLHDKT